VVTIVTDGATEAFSPDERELGDERLVQALSVAAGESAERHLAVLFDAVSAWTAERGCSDDLTALVLRAL
jgi:serine phosphatase RsbU (regulator of sigma subunit)